MLIAATVCPSPPLLVAGVGSDHDHRLEQLRAACWSGLDSLRFGSPQLLVLVAADDATVEDLAGRGSLEEYGVPREVSLPGHEDAHGSGLPLSLSVGAWLLERDGWPGPVVAATVSRTAGVDECAQLGERLAQRAERVAMLVMADGSSQRSDEQTEAVRRRAEVHDSELVRTLEEGEPRQLLTLDEASAAQAGADGVNPLRVMAGAAEDGVFDAELLYQGAPFGVGYVVAVWERHG